MNTEASVGGVNAPNALAKDGHVAVPAPPTDSPSGKRPSRTYGPSVSEREVAADSHSSVLLDTRHHYGAPVGKPACLVIERHDPQACPNDGIYWITGEDNYGQFSFGSCIDHTAQIRAVRPAGVAFRVVSITSDHPYREAS